MSMQPPAPAGRLVWTCAGFLVWSAAFVALYSVLSVGCRFGWDETIVAAGISLQRIVLVALFLVSLAAGWLLVRLGADARRRAERGGAAPIRRFLEFVGWLGALAALGSTLISLGPVLFTTACY